MRKHLLFAASIAIGPVFFGSAPAHAETTITKPADGWEVYTSGRVGAFVEVLNGDSAPITSATAGHTVTSEGIVVQSDPGANGPNSGHATASRVRSGFLGNILTLGVRRELTPATTVSGQISLWAAAEAINERTYLLNQTDMREGFLKLEGPAGTLKVGRQLSLFSRGGTEIDFLYGHQFGVGSPVGFNYQGPSGGHIGYGVLGAVFAAGVVYSTPPFAGLQLNAGYFDPGSLVGQHWGRTKAGRFESEVTYDANFGNSGKVHVFADGAVQKLYAVETADAVSVYGASAGARLEVGPFHIGVAGHSGKGLGIGYFLDWSDSMLNGNTYQLRNFDGAYVQTQLALTKFDFNVGWGVTRLHQLTADIDPKYFLPGATGPATSYLKSQMGISAVVVYHISPNLHAAVDYFRSDQKWWLGESQVLNSYNVGMTLTW